ncbi:MAG: hypothetical protein WC150_05480 [Bacteroidia bacterium]
MKNNYTLLLFFAAFCLISVQCKKDDDSYAKELAKLPPATTKGHNTFGCLINGKAFPSGAPGEHMPLAYYENNELYISYSTRLDPFSPILDKGVSLRIFNKIYSEGIFQINPTGNDHFSAIWDGDVYHSYLCNIPQDKVATIVITRFDSIHHILSGMFSFKAKSRKNDKILLVEHGRFDFSYQ